MKFKYRRTGGIANIKIEREFDSDSLPATHITTFNHLIKSTSTKKASVPDEFIHELRTSNKTIRFLDSELSPEALALFAFLVSLRQ